jgi:gliding motility-associated-like protein
MHAPPVALTANADANNTIKWYDENNVLLSQPPVISTTNPAQFIFFATQTNMYGCVSAQEKFVAIVHPVAKIIGSSYTNPTLCGIPSGSVTLNVVDLNGNTMPNLPVHVHYTKFQTDYSVADSTDASGKIIIPLTAGTYSDFYVETFGCLSQKIPNVFILKDPTPPAQPIAGYNAPLCSEQIFNLSASSATSNQNGIVNYVWVGPAFGNMPDTSLNTTVSFPSAKTSYNGIYIVYAIQNNCISTATSFPVEIKQSPAEPTIKTRTPLCIGDNLSLTATSSIIGNNTLNYVWNGPGTGFPVNSANAGITNVKIEDGGVYSITVTSPETGCSVTADTLIQIGGYPIVKFSKDSFNVPTGYTMHITPAILNATDKNILPIAKYEWTPSDNVQCNDSACSLPTVIVKKNICYTVKAINIYGCSGSDTICISTFCNNTQVFIPNAFTPKGAAVNAKFMIRASGIASIKSFRVFNRWGRIVFEKNNFPPNDPAYAWDGYVNGKLADMGVYVYTVDVVCENGTPYTYKGNVTLLQ